jgi:hypothetical protein
MAKHKAKRYACIHPASRMVWIKTMGMYLEFHVCHSQWQKTCKLKGIYWVVLSVCNFETISCSNGEFNNLLEQRRVGELSITEALFAV